MIENKNFCILRNKNTETFAIWSQLLNEIGVKWTDITKKLIRIILVLPIGSADAERGFSIMNNIKKERRSRLNPTLLEDIMRIQINTEDDISLFAARKYAQQWVKENHLRSDDNRYIHTREPKSTEKKFLPKLSFL